VEGGLSAWHVSNSQLWALTMQRLPSLAFATRTSNAVAGEHCLFLVFLSFFC
jgi:hypothetical protein